MWCVPKLISEHEIPLVTKLTKKLQRHCYNVPDPESITHSYPIRYKLQEAFYIPIIGLDALIVALYSFFLLVCYCFGVVTKPLQ